MMEIATIRIPAGILQFFRQFSFTFSTKKIIQYFPIPKHAISHNGSKFDYLRYSLNSKLFQAIYFAAMPFAHCIYYNVAEKFI